MTRPTLLRALVALVVLALVSTFAGSAGAVSDPSLRWYTIETAHFKVTYHSGLEEAAQHVANIGEDIHRDMTNVMGYAPRVKTELLLTDFSESANGSAGATPYNAIRLLVTAPEDMSPLGDVDDWHFELLTHEYTHILHIDNIHGIPALVNAVVGKTLAPNQIQPRFIIEGYGVFQESNRSSAGRLRNSMWEMFMRTDVLEDNVAPIDQISNVVRRWPQGNLFYLYGSYFTKWISDTYGEEALRKTSRDYGSELVPWGFNRSMRRANGTTYVDMYPAWIASMKTRYGAQAAAVRQKGIREGKRLTHHGQIARNIRWIPTGSLPEHEGHLLYYRDDQHGRPGLVALPIERDGAGSVTASDERHAELVARTSTESAASFAPDGSVVFSSAEFEKNFLLYGELQKLEKGDKSAFGTPDGGRVRLLEGRRASDPSISPDGRQIVYTVNRGGTRSLYIADLGDKSVTNERPLVTSSFTEQAFLPRFSPDGSHVVYSVWKRGGYRDIRYVDVRTGQYEDLMEDRAVDGGPSFSADGRYVFFHSDRTGIMNVYAFDLASREISQVTNVLTGAYLPEPSPDGKTLAYVGYGKSGFDVFAMRLDPRRWTPAEPYVDTHPEAPVTSNRRFDVKPYSAWSTIAPRKYGVQITEGSFGRAVIVNASGTDIAGLHAVSASMTSEFERPELQGGLSYVYGRLPFDFGMSLSRVITPRGGYQLGAGYKPTIVQETASIASSLSYALPGPYDTHSFVVSHVFSRVGADLPRPIERLDPYETPALPPRGFTSTLHLGYSYTNAERYLYSVGGERGFSTSAAVDLTDPSLGSDYAGFVFNADFVGYLLMPWFRHHSLALHAGGGTSGGAFPGRGAFYVGSFVDLPIVDVVRNTLIQGGITLRGYPSVVLSGRSSTLANLEYRFPIVNIDRGPSTLPFFLNRISGNVFFDYGSAFDDFQNAQFKSGTGAELWFDTTLGYLVPFTFRLGYARGLASAGIDKTYFVAAVPY